METNKQVAVITGGNSGIGYATAKTLVAKGIDVIITGRRREAVEQAARVLNATGMVADQSKIDDIEKLVAQIKERYGTIDLLLINAGMSGFSMIEHTEESRYDEIMNVNLKGAYFTLSKFIPLLNNGASVVLLSSTSAHISPVSASVYAASKAALNAVMRIAARELAPHGVRVNAVSPGPVATEIMSKLGVTDDLESQMISSIPMRRMGEADEVANVVAFLFSGQASFITGSEYFVDGGQCA